MQYDPRRERGNINEIFHDNRYPSIYHPPYETRQLYQPYSELPTYTQCIQESMHGINCIVPNTSHQQQEVVRSSTDQPCVEREVSKIITSKVQAVLIISGILYFLFGGITISLEIAIIMYSHSIHYRGIWIGATMLGLGINTFIIAYRFSHSISYMVMFSASALIFILCGIISTSLDLGFTIECSDHVSASLCKKQLAVPLKVTLLIELSICAIHIAINLVVINRIRQKSMSRSNVQNAQSS